MKPPLPTQAKRVRASEVTLRAVGDEDAGFIRSLYLQTMLPLLTELGLGDEPRLRTRFLKSYRPASSLIPQMHTTDVGWIQVTTSPSEFHLDQLHLVAGWRNRGIGGHLLQGLLDRARGAGATVALDVLRGNPAHNLYRRLGFRTVGEDHEKYQMRWWPEENATNPRR